MAGFCFWLVILIFIIFSVRKGRKSSNHSEQPPVHPQRPERTERAPERKSASPHRSYSLQSYAEKPQTSAGKKNYGSEKSSSVAKTTGNERKNKEARKQREADLQAVFDENQIVAAAKVNTREVELDNDRDAEEEHLMDAVYDAMIKGPHNSMDFQRDFIAEGMDMLNSFDL